MPECRHIFLRGRELAWSAGKPRWRLGTERHLYFPARMPQIWLSKLLNRELHPCGTQIMATHDDTEMGGGGASFPTTHWSLLAAVKGPMTDGHRQVLNLLIERYWRPVYYYIRRRGHKDDVAMDLAQEFFASWLAKELFGRADRTRGRFRAFLLSSLDNFLRNVHRAEHAKRRFPPGGLVSLEDLVKGESVSYEPSDAETPEVVFNQIWLSELLGRVLLSFEQECTATGKEAHYELLRCRIIEPVLEGTEPPPLRDLARNLGLTEKQAANMLITARRAYQRLLRQEIQIYAASEDDVAFEVRDLFEFLARP